ncbi:hypothetical protein L1987_45986 [Smallanthus sonchifolius]|uniref:Uncharacterized protein n=1 Tax=Smallanthus sonchifolius TaxID=185202 RepID=A0ACB9FXX6_9ASTR|nr:hypothetical protein L1987_45986 [Smallanthus sonchifolius]
MSHSKLVSHVLKQEAIINKLKGEKMLSEEHKEKMLSDEHREKMLSDEEMLSDEHRVVSILNSPGKTEEERNPEVKNLYFRKKLRKKRVDPCLASGKKITQGMSFEVNDKPRRSNRI